MKEMEDWEKELDNIDWKTVLDDIDRALADNLAAELGFPSFERLEQASELVVDQYYVTHLSDGRWAWWNPQNYAHEDPAYFSDKQEITAFIADFLQLDEKKMVQLQDGLNQVIQTKRCRCCEHEFNPADPVRRDWDAGQEQSQFCSAECAMETVLNEMKEDFDR
ncbi:hypothetical protein ACFO25_08035 [Paenactinomyces guangxiensis]|uniref:Uncharacterized protein n=1 Tax=Paenactinomyces guangxiensis TaxID=1490290 RepID=A0A7W2A652_9BACL|nr:hypothetical protein [Paenactinomyces guangxiensis]MBA4493006.1 hypothetical protein [Paenactinomyces guangxiensis]MBH8590145.1 hypothetical protein [Paenactinomyces guangxiensis]